MVIKIFVLIFFLCFSISVNSQIEKFLYNIEKNDGTLDVEKLSEKIHLDTGKNILFLSEDRHNHIELEKARMEVIKKLGIDEKFDLLFWESNLPDDILLTDYVEKRMDIDSFVNSLGDYFQNNPIIDEEKSNIKNTQDLELIQALRKSSKRLASIDIGTGYFYLGLIYFARYTKSLNFQNDRIIDRFCDTLEHKYALEFHASLETHDSDEKFKERDVSMQAFLTALRKYDSYRFIANAWESVFARYYQMHDYFIKYGYVNFSDRNEFQKRNSFRDSVLFKNFNFYLNQSKNWKKIAVSFSTFHLLDTRDTVQFRSVINPADHTLGKYLRLQFRDNITHIAFVCNSGRIKEKGYDNKYYKKSLEYRLAKKYRFAYVDLREYKRSPTEKEPFYLRPTYSGFIKTNWENVLDGIVFVNNCGCNK